MPDDESILGFSNRWYRDAVQTAEYYILNDQVKVKFIKPAFFVATKLEAYLGRGNNDPLSSHDIEDLLNVYDGRVELLSEIKKAPPELKNFISNQISDLLKNNDFEYAVQSCSLGDQLRGQLIFTRLEDTCKL